MAIGAVAILVGGFGLIATGTGNPTTGNLPASATALAKATAAVTPTSSPSGAPSPSPSPTAAPLAASPVPSAPTVETVAAFLARWTTAFQTGDSTFLLERLNPVVTTRYGVPACQAAINRQLDPKEVNVLLSSSGPGTWTWVASGQSVPVADVYTAEIERTFRGVTTRVTFHFALQGGTLTWFDACSP
jgi:hypothetical protein